MIMSIEARDSSTSTFEPSYPRINDIPGQPVSHSDTIYEETYDQPRRRIVSPNRIRESWRINCRDCSRMAEPEQKQRNCERELHLRQTNLYRIFRAPRRKSSPTTTVTCYIFQFICNSFETWESQTCYDTKVKLRAECIKTKFIET